MCYFIPCRYIQDGELAKPGVMRSPEYEAVLRGWLPLKDVAWLVLLSIFTDNAFVSLCFEWGHDNSVYTRGDKAVMLYSGILSTFLAVVFFEGGTQGVAKTFWGSLLDSVLSSLLAAVMMFPVQYGLPYVVVVPRRRW